MKNTIKFVEFDKCCKFCKHRDLEDSKDPCCECLDNPVNYNSKKPYFYEEDPKKVKEEQERIQKEERAAMLAMRRARRVRGN